MALSPPQLNLAKSLTTVYPPPQGKEALVGQAFKGSLKTIPESIQDYMQAIVAAAHGQTGLLEAVEACMKGHLEARNFKELPKDSAALKALKERAETQVRKMSLTLDYEKEERTIEAARATIDQLVDEANQALQAAETRGKKRTKAPSQRTIKARETKLRAADIERNVALMELKRLKGLILRIKEKEEISGKMGGVWEAAVKGMTTQTLTKNFNDWSALARRVDSLLTAYQAYEVKPTVFNKVCLGGLINQHLGAAGVKRKAEKEPAAEPSSQSKRRRKNPKRAGSALRGAR